MKLISRKPLLYAQVYGALKRRQKEGALGYEQQATLELFEKLRFTSLKKATTLVARLNKLGIEQEPAVALANMLPRKPEEVRAILERWRVSLSDEALRNVLEAVKEAKEA